MICALQPFLKDSLFSSTTEECTWKHVELQTAFDDRKVCRVVFGDGWFSSLEKRLNKKTAKWITHQHSIEEHNDCSDHSEGIK